MHPTALGRVLQAIAQRPQDSAFIYQGQSLSYRQLGSLLNAGARELRARGIRPGDAVGIRLRQSPLHCVAVLALLRLGALAVPLRDDPWRSGQDELLARFGIGTVLADGDVPAGSAAVIRFEQLKAAAAEPDPLPDFHPDPQQPALLALSSGTTGEPKGVLYSQAGLAQRIDCTVFDWPPRSRFLPPLLNSPVATLSALGALGCGATVVFPDSYEFSGLAAAIRAQAVTHLYLTPVTAAALVAWLPEPAAGEGPAFPSLRQLRLLGAAPPERLIADLRRRCTPWICAPYATTELGVLSMATPESLEAAPRSAGRPMPWVRLEVVDAQGRPLPAGAQGEIRVATAVMPRAYYRDAGRSARQFRDGWFYPGDIGRLGQDGLLYVDGRGDEVINVGGQKVLPAFIERVLLQHPQVREAAAFEFRSADGGALPAAAVVAAGPVADLARYCERELGVLSPRRLFLLPALPRNDMGKVPRKELPGLVAALARDAAPPQPDALQQP
ncbi:MAG: acyl--CoA ligase [Nevskia sp.]|nr:acyl--CoA ligase [Nevskia sp.]